MTINQIIEKLAEIGLTPNQITVYLELIKSKKCRASTIIKNSKLHRSIVYVSLDELTKKGLASKLVQNGVSVFEASSPINLVEMIDIKRRAAEAVADDLTKIMQQAPRDIRIFEGEEGVLNARERSLDLPPDETVYVLGVSQLTTTPAYESMWIPYHKKRIKGGIKSKLFFDRTASPEQLASRKAMPLTEAKYLPFKLDMPAWFEVYGTTFAIGVPAQEPVVFSMHSPEASSALKNFFDYLWNQDAMVENGYTSIQRSLDAMLDELSPGEKYYFFGEGLEKHDISEMSDFHIQFHKKRIAKKVTMNGIAPNGSVVELQRINKAAGDPEGILSSMKRSDAVTGNPVDTYLYNGKAMLVIRGKEPMVISIENRSIYDSFKTYFDALWQKVT